MPDAQAEMVVEERPDMTLAVADEARQKHLVALIMDD
jgi:hypothetical protein